ncbi:MAG TPA: DoxX family protein [Candidatus Saccharimonadales bacterium]|nr:DoxX family protein [Candidatus Saccharimonadales bacterium]
MVITAPDYSHNLLLLLVRLVVGTAFIVSARNKNRDIRKFSKNDGVPVPVAVLVMVIEYISGLALVLGVYAQIGAIALMVLMLGTLRLHIFKWKSPYWAQSGGWEYDLIMFTLAGVILVFGSGSIALVR